MRKTPQELFKSHVEVDDKGCWIWTGSRFSSGYGQFSYTGRNGHAHRAAWRMFVGPMNGLQVLHKCDVRACVNPDHLFLGTQAENIQDMIQKGRRINPDRKGERNSQSKLTESTVQAIRERYRLGEKQVDLAAAFGITQALVSLVVRRDAWKHVA